MQTDLSDPTTATLAIASAIERARIPGAVYGGLALAAYGEPRETRDADFAVAGVSCSAVMDALRAAGMDCSLSFERTRFGGNHVSRIALFGAPGATGLNVLDLVEPMSLRYAVRVLERALEGSLREQQVRIVAPEDYVVLKFLSTRDRDLEDAASVVRGLAGRLDRALIDQEVAALASEIPDHDVPGRAIRVFALAG